MISLYLTESLRQISRLFIFLLTRLISYSINDFIELIQLLRSDKALRNPLFDIRLEQSRAESHTQSVNDRLTKIDDLYATDRQATDITRDSLTR